MGRGSGVGIWGSGFRVREIGVLEIFLFDQLGLGLACFFSQDLRVSSGWIR